MEKVIHLESVDSTNNYLRKLAAEGCPHGQFVVAQHQTAGRGRMGRSFVSQEGTGIYLSWLLRPDCSPTDILPITCMSAVAVCDAIYKCYEIKPQIKWVNDLVLNQRKICGILTEMLLTGNKISHVIVGIGINVNNLQEEFPSELRDIATSLFMETGKQLDISILTDELICQLESLGNILIPLSSPGLELQKDSNPAPDYYWHEYCKNNIVPGNDIRIITPHGEKIAYAQEINRDFSLKVCYPGGITEDISSCEVTIRKK